MGATLSSSAEPTREERDIQILGDCYPFGDSELRHLYDSYHAIFYTDFVSSSHSSFLQDLAVECFRRRQQNHPRLLLKQDDTEQEDSVLTRQSIDEWLAVVRAMEEILLPKGFGNRMYRNSFIAAGTPSIYNEAHTGNPFEQEDSYLRQGRLETFFEALSNCTRRGSKAVLSVMFSACDVTARGINASEFISLGYRLALSVEYLRNGGEEDARAYLPETDSACNSTLKALARSVVEQRKKRLQMCSDSEDDEMVEMDDILEWSESVAPIFASILPTFLHYIIFPGKIYRPTGRTSFDFPWITDSSKKSAFFSAPSSPLLFTFGCLSASLGGSYFCLYTSNHDGLSFNRLQNALVGYSGPTLLLVRAADQDCILGAFTASPWKESKDFYGNTDCFIFQMSPRTSVFRPTGNSRNFMYCNSFARSRGYDKQAHGLGFGGTSDQPRLFFPESFEECRASNRDLTFAHGQLLRNGTTFELDSLEVWGVGGNDIVQAALGERLKLRASKDEALRKARKVDRAQFLDDFQSGIVESKAFAHRAQVDRGRAGEFEDEKARIGNGL